MSINLRGRIIPVVDLRSKFGMPRIGDTELTCIIVVDVVHGAGVVQTGIIVDTVSEVIDIAKGDIEEAPEFGSSVVTDFILGDGQAQGFREDPARDRAGAR